MQSTEIWKPVYGYEGIYEVTNLGRVRSLTRITAKNAVKEGAEKAVWVAGNGYPTVCLYKNGKGTNIPVHTLILEAFVGPRPEGHVARHLNGVRTDSVLNNLEWGTYSQNMLDRRAHETDPQVSKTHCPRGHRLEEPNLVPSKLKVGARQCLACSRAKSSRSGHVEADEHYERILSGEHAWSHKREGLCRRGHRLEGVNVWAKRDGKHECASCRRAYWHGTDDRSRYEISWKFYREMEAKGL